MLLPRFWFHVPVPLGGKGRAVCPAVFRAPPEHVDAAELFCGPRDVTVSKSLHLHSFTLLSQPSTTAVCARCVSVCCVRRHSRHLASSPHVEVRCRNAFPPSHARAHTGFTPSSHLGVLLRVLVPPIVVRVRAVRGREVVRGAGVAAGNWDRAHHLHAGTYAGQDWRSGGGTPCNVTPLNPSCPSILCAA